jgi:eukaryotic-like serine/threonine-protein kinase
MAISIPPPDLHAGSTLGRYELLLPIAKGGMAQVWAARLHGSRGFQKLVAVKTILAGSVDNDRMEQMFLEEAQLASQIHHPNVVGTLDLGEHAGVLYLVMEWVEGEPLSAVMAKAAGSGGVPLAIGVNLIGQACQGLSAAHDLRDENGALLGVVHRDVSPQNLLVTYSGTAKVVDFGIAKATSKSSALTEAGEIKGKFSYMAPEQVRGLALDCRADLFALGIVLYAITTGRHPFRGEHPAQTVQNICAERGPTPPSAFITDYPAALEQVVLKALAKDPEHRFESATAMLTALEKAMPGPLEASFEKQVAAYLKQLFGNRASERRAALRVAQESADRTRAESSSSISLGTLRAIAIDQSGGVGPISASAPPSQQQQPQHLTATLQSTSVPTSAPSRSRKLAMISGGALLAVALAGAASLNLGGSDAERAKAAGSSPVPSISLDQVKPVVSAVPRVEAAAIVATPAASESSEPAAPARDETPRKSSKRERALAARPTAPAVAGVPKSTPPAAAAPAAAPSPATPGATPSANAWDRGAFGGRH